MERTELQQQLARWIDEFAAIKEQEVPRGLPLFLSERLSEMFQDMIAEDWNVVKARVLGNMKRIRIKGRRGQYLDFDGADERDKSFGMMAISDVIPEDQPKLANILDRLEGTQV